jgi:hypothetical protein
MMDIFFSFHLVALHRASLISCVLSFILSCNSSTSYGFPMVVIKDVDSTIHKVDAVHDPMQFEHDGDPNLQKNICVTT